MGGSLFFLKEKPTLKQVFSSLLILFAVGTGVFKSGELFDGVSIQGILWGVAAVVGILLQTLISNARFKSTGFQPVSFEQVFW